MQPDHRIDMVLTSPPYDDIRSYQGYSWDPASVFAELYRVLCPGGVVIWNVSDATKNGSETGNSMRQALLAMQQGFKLHDTMIYVKRNPMPTNRITRRYHQAWEYIFAFSKGTPKTWNPIEVPAKFAGTEANMKYRGKSGEICYKKTPRNDRTKLRNVFEYVIGGGHSAPDGQAHDHPAIMPYQLALDQIQTWSNPDDLIYDPFAGSGTTLLAARQLSRNAVGTEISAKYCDLAVRRLTN